MDILGFINSNGTLSTILGSIITALISAIVAIVIDNKKSKVDSVRTLKTELAETKQKLEELQAVVNNYRSIEKAETNIDKSTGAIYVETLPNGSKRNICGYCWESKRTKIPLTMASYYDDEDGKWVIRGICGSCNARCYDE